ncbi:MFS transporter [Streptosporangium subroseum]|uniref:MFS transporter n=1 Tax=Streptosporangium subroseum TaxID=106412 RepID=UPI003091AA6F|nr:MFS transporter [Streptosporangium subroseum]
MLKLLAQRQVRLFLLADTFSNFGSSALWLALAVAVQELTRSASSAGLVMFAFALGSLFLPVSGLVVDRLRRRPLLIAVNLLTPVLLLPLILVTERDRIWVVYLVMFAYGVSGSLSGPAQAALLPRLVPEELLGDANGALQTIRGLLRIVAPMAGAGLYAWHGANVLVAIDIVTFLVAAAILLAIKVDEPAPQPSEQHWVAEVGSGIRYIAKTRVLRQLVLTCGLAMLAIGFYESVGFVVVTVGLGHEPSYVGVLGSAMGVGTVAGGATASGVMRRTGESLLVAWSLVACAVCSAMLTTPYDAVVVAGMFLLGVTVPWMVVGVSVAIQRTTPVELLGRSFAAFELSVTVPQTASMAVGAGLIAVLDYRLLLLAITVVGMLTAGYLFIRRPVPGADELSRKQAGGPAPQPGEEPGHEADHEELEPSKP